MKDYPAFTVSNFTDVNSLTVSGDRFNDLALVHLIQASGGLRFQHSMTLDQAEELCKRLQQVAESLKGFTLTQ